MTKKEKNNSDNKRGFIIRQHGYFKDLDVTIGLRSTLGEGSTCTKWCGRKSLTRSGEQGCDIDRPQAIVGAAVRVTRDESLVSCL